jgi:hypothetical protein
MPSTLVEFIEKDELVREELEEFEGEFERGNCKYELFILKQIVFLSFINLHGSSFITIIRKETQNK